MSNIDLKLIPGQTTSIVLLDSEFGEVANEVSNDFLNEVDRESEEIRLRYQEIRRSNVPIETFVREFGEKLFAGIFFGSTLDLFNRSVGGAHDGQINLRIMLGEAQLNRILWEVLRFRDEFLCFRHSVIRHPFVSRPIQIPRQKRKKLRILAIAVDPKYGDATVVDEHRDMCKLFSEFRDQIEFISLYQNDATVDNILDCFFEGVDIFHFTGRGLFDAKNPQDSALVVWPANKNEKYGLVSVRTLRTLTLSQNLGFCFLNACDTARSAPKQLEVTEATFAEESFVSIAHALIRSGVPVVIATNYAITVRAASVLSKRFYTSIIRHGRRIDQAIRDARGELFIRRGDGVLESDWACPTLYARSRQMALGTEDLERATAFDIFALRNVARPVFVSAHEEPVRSNFEQDDEAPRDDAAQCGSG